MIGIESVLIRCTRWQAEASDQHNGHWMDGEADKKVCVVCGYRGGQRGACHCVLGRLDQFGCCFRTCLRTVSRSVVVEQDSRRKLRIDSDLPRAMRCYFGASAPDVHRGVCSVAQSVLNFKVLSVQPATLSPRSRSDIPAHRHAATSAAADRAHCQ